MGHQTIQTWTTWPGAGGWREKMMFCWGLNWYLVAEHSMTEQESVAEGWRQTNWNDALGTHLYKGRWLTSGRSSQGNWLIHHFFYYTKQEHSLSGIDAWTKHQLLSSTNRGNTIICHAQMIRFDLISLLNSKLLHCLRCNNTRTDSNGIFTELRCICSHRHKWASSALHWAEGQSKQLK